MYTPQPGVPDNIISGAPARLLERLHKDRDALKDLMDTLQGGLDVHD